MKWVSRVLRQPDQRSCGAACLVVARMLNDPAYAELLETGTHPRTGHTLAGGPVERFAAEVTAMHRRITGPVDVRGEVQLPWPERFGTPPWAVAHQLTGSSGVRGATYDAELVRPSERAAAFDALVAAVRSGHAVPVYVGSRFLPRHVILAIAETPTGVRAYEPAQGTRIAVTRDDFVDGTLDAAGWRVPWFVVLPSGRAG